MKVIDIKRKLEESGIGITTQAIRKRLYEKYNYDKTGGKAFKIPQAIGDEIVEYYILKRGI